MASDADTSPLTWLLEPPSNGLRPRSRHKKALRRRRISILRLGGKKPRKAVFLVRLFRPNKLRSVRMKWMSMVKKIKSYYKCLVKEMGKGGGSEESYQQRVMKASIVIPVMGFNFTTASPPPYYYAS